MNAKTLLCIPPVSIIPVSFINRFVFGGRGDPERYQNGFKYLDYVLRITNFAGKEAGKFFLNFFYLYFLKIYISGIYT